MDNPYFNCPHCGGQIKAIGQKSAPLRTARSFQSVSAFNVSNNLKPPPIGRIRSFLWFMLGKHKSGGPLVIEQSATPPVIRVEHWTDDLKHTLLNQLDGRISESDLWRVSDVLIRQERSWSRSNLCRYASLSQTKYHIIKDEFVRLNYIFLKPGNVYIILRRGMSFLRECHTTLPH